MNKKTGLGKGLNALFVDSNIIEENVFLKIIEISIGIIEIAFNTTMYINGTAYIASNFPVITPNEPPDTKNALGDILPFELRRVNSAAWRCIIALPVVRIIITTNGLTLKLNKTSAPVVNTVPRTPKFILILISCKYP